MNNLLDNPEHIGIIQRFVDVSKKRGRIMTLERVVFSVANHLFPEYAQDPQLEDKIKTILTIQ